MCGAGCWTDHRLVVSKLNLRIQPARRPQGKKAPKRPDVSKLNQDSMRQAFINDICNHLGAMNISSEDPEEKWTVFQNVVQSSAATTLGHPFSKHQDWFFYENMPMEHTAIIHGRKNDNFHLNCFAYFLIFAQNIDLCAHVRTASVRRF